LSPGSTIDDFDIVLLDAFFYRLACLSRRKSFFTSLDVMEHPLHVPSMSEYLENLNPDGYPMVCPLCHEMIQGIEWSCALDDVVVPSSDRPVVAHATPDGVVLVEPCTDHPLFCRRVPIHSESK
jgi:hypothetical protein